jgi:putative DNA primase/helicase
MSNINICAQDAYLALYPQSKKPVGVNWPDEGKSLEQALATNGNLGLLLGPKSDVMDVDLDCEKQRALLN